MSKVAAQAPTRPWQDVVAEKIASRDAAIPKGYLLPPSEMPPASQSHVLDTIRNASTLTPTEHSITDLPVSDLLASLASGKLSAVGVLTAFAKKAVVVHQLTNCLTEVFFERAMQKAQALDDAFQKTGKVVGPLHGLPISLKDQVKVEGVDCTLGYVSWIGQISKASSPLATLLERAGAVLYVKTNLPQSIMRTETDNNVFGLTTNPHNRTLTPGGSSGGEGALVAGGGSPLGVGTDLGGSVRTPAALCGLWGFRPCYNRLPYHDVANTLLGQESILSVLGPLSKSHSGLVTFFKAIIDAQPWLLDPVVTEKKWDQAAYELDDLEGSGKKKLCFAVMWDDGVVRPIPPIRRALEHTKAALLAAGHEVIDWQPLNHGKSFELVLKLFKADGGQDVRNACAASGEPVLYSHIGDESTNLSVYEHMQVNSQRIAYRKLQLDHWSETATRTSTGRPVDAIICPSAPWVAPPHGKHKYNGYTSVWSLLDYPVCAFPTGLSCDPSTEPTSASPPLPPLSEIDEQITGWYQPNLVEGAPIGLQCVGRRGREEQTLGLAKVVGDALESARKT